MADGLLELSRAIAFRPNAEQPELTTMALAVVCAAIPGTCWASLTHGGSSPSTAASSHQVATTLDQLQYQGEQGPCLTAIEHGSVVQSDFATEARWPDFISQARHSPATASVSYPLAAAGHPGYSLNIYTETPMAETDRVMADLAAAGFALSFTAVEERARAAHLQTALESSRRIGAALGILMSEHKITDEQAFALLRNASQNSHRKLRDIAEDVLLIGTLPED